MKSTAVTKHLTPLNLLYFVLGTLLLVILLLQVDFQGLTQQVLNIPPGLLLLGGVLYLCKGAARGVRFWRMNAAARPGYWKMLRLTFATSLASQLLPFKLGELTYVYVVKRELRTPISQGLSALIIIRIFDLLAIALLFVLAAAVLSLPGDFSIYFNYILALIGGLLALLAGFIFAGKYFAILSARLLALTWLRRVRLAQKMQQSMAELLAELGKFRGRQYVELIAYPLIEWGINFVMYGVLLRGIGLSPRALDPVVAVTFAALANLLPLNSVGNFGVQDAGWTSGMLLLGYPQDIALTSALSTHLLALGYMLVLGGIAWLSYLVRPGAAQETAAPTDCGESAVTRKQ